MPRKKTTKTIEEGKKAVELFEIEERVEKKAQGLIGEYKKIGSLSEIFRKLRHTLKDVALKRAAEKEIKRNYESMREECREPHKLDKVYMKSMELLSKILASDMPIKEKEKLYHNVVVKTLRDMDMITIKSEEKERV